jgi:uncharacterized membrane protein YfcA
MNAPIVSDSSRTCDVLKLKDLLPGSITIAPLGAREVHRQMHWSLKALILLVLIVALLCVFDLLFDYYFDRKF